MARELTPEQIAEDRRRWKMEMAQRVADSVNKTPKPPSPAVKPQRAQRVIQPTPAPKTPKEFPPGVVDIPYVRAKQDAAKAAAKEELAARVESLGLNALTAGGPGSGWHAPPKGDHTPGTVPGGEDESDGGEKKPSKKEAAAKKKAAKSVYPLREARKEREAREAEKNDPKSPRFEPNGSTPLRDLPKDYYARDHFDNPNDVDWENGTVDFPFGQPPHPERKMTAADRETGASRRAAIAEGRDDKIWGPEFDRKGRETPEGNRKLFNKDHALNDADSARIIHSEPPGGISDGARSSLTDPRNGKLYTPTDIVMQHEVEWQTMVRHKDPIVMANEPEHTREIRTNDKIVISKDKLLKRKAAVTRAEENLELAKGRSKEDVVEKQRDRLESAKDWKAKLQEKDGDGNYVYGPEYIRERAKAKVESAERTHGEIKDNRNLHRTRETAQNNLDRAKSDLEAFRAADIKTGPTGNDLNTPGRIAQRERTLQGQVDKHQADVDSKTEALSYTKVVNGKAVTAEKPKYTAEELSHAQRKVSDAKEDQARAERKAQRFEENPENYRKKILTQADTNIAAQQKKLTNYTREPEEARLAEIHNAEEYLKTAIQQRDDVAKSYAFTSAKADLARAAGEDNKLNLASKVDVPDDPQNLYNLHYGNGPVILYIEGTQKTWSGLEAVRKEFPNAAVIGIGSVDGWEHSEMGKLALEHMKGRDVFGVYDSDGVGRKPNGDPLNKSVMQGSGSLHGLLERNGVRSFSTAAPRLDEKGGIRQRMLRSGAPEGFKGGDDGLAGGDTLASFPTQTKTVPPIEKFSLAKEWSQPTESGGTRAGKTQRPTEELYRSMALSADKDGYLTLSWNRAQAMMQNTNDSTLSNQLDILVKSGKVEKIDRYVENPDGTRYPNPTAEDLAKRGIISPLSDDPYGSGFYEPSPVYRIVDPALRPTVETGTIGDRIANAPAPTRPSGQHVIQDTDAIAYYEKIYGRSFQVGDVIPFGDIPDKSLYEGAVDHG